METTKLRLLFHLKDRLEHLKAMLFIRENVSEILITLLPGVSLPKLLLIQENERSFEAYYIMTIKPAINDQTDIKSLSLFRNGIT